MPVVPRVGLDYVREIPESAGKRFSGRTRKGDGYLRRILVQSGWAAARTRDCFLAALFNRIAHRRGFKKAVVAVAHRILTIAWSMDRNTRNAAAIISTCSTRNVQLAKLTRRLERIGFEVILKPVAGHPRAEKLPMPTTS